MRKLKVNSENWLWSVGRFHVVIRQEGTPIKYVVPKHDLGIMWGPQCSCGPQYNCYVNDKLRRKITPKHIRAYIDSQRKSD